MVVVFCCSEKEKATRERNPENGFCFVVPSTSLRGIDRVKFWSIFGFHSVIDFR
jgi:hypothetical protein